MALGEALGNILGGVLGGNAAKSDRGNAKDAMKQAAAVFDQIGLPPDTAKELILQQLQRQGVYTPQLEQDLNDTFAEVQLVKDSVEGRQGQLQSIAQQQQVAKSGGSAITRAALEKIKNDWATTERGRRESIKQELAARHMAGSGAELSADLQGDQAAQNQAAMMAMQAASDQENRRIAGIQALNQMQSGLRSQDIGLSRANTDVINERNRFLAQNSIARQQANVASLNQAQLSNLQEQQRIADANAAMMNAEKQRQAQAQAAQYDQKLAYARGKSGAQQDLGKYLGDLGDQKAQQQKELAGGIGGIGDAVVGAAMGGAGPSASSGWGTLLGKIGSK